MKLIEIQLIWGLVISITEAHPTTRASSNL